MVPTVFTFSVGMAYASSPVFNTDGADSATSRVANYTTNTDWLSSVSGSNGNVILFDIYYHNNGTDTATNTITRIDFPTTATSAITVTGSVSADNAATVSSNNTIK